MINLIPLTTDYLDAAVELYEQAFPPAERRPTASWISLIKGEAGPAGEAFLPFALLHDDAFCGFITAWQLDGFVYGEHFATLPTLRGHGLGGQGYEAFLKRFDGQPVVIEVEPPTTPITRRRIGFYERHGMTLLTSVPYRQPAYGPDLPSIPLCLMANLPHEVEPMSGHVIGQIYQRVYHVSPDQTALSNIK